MKHSYLSANLDLLYQAIGQQAEEDFLTALQREFPRMDDLEKEQIVNYWRKLSKKAEARLAEQGE